MDSHTFLISEEWSVTPFLLVNGQSHFPFCDEWSVTLFLFRNDFSFCEMVSHTFLFVMNGQSQFSY